jgi:hypothetical protein
MDDHSQLRCTLTFERSPSPYYPEALRLARAVPGYMSDDEGAQTRHIVPITVAAMPVAERLLRIVSGWRGSVVDVDGVDLYGVEMLRLLGMLSCFRRHERSRLGLSYCWGLPDGERGRVPCRLISSALPWTPPENYSHPDLLPNLIRALAAGTFAALCPAYDAPSVQSAAASWAGGEGLPRSLFEDLLGDVDIDQLG